MARDRIHLTPADKVFVSREYHRSGSGHRDPPSPPVGKLARVSRLGWMRSYRPVKGGHRTSIDQSVNGSEMRLAAYDERRYPGQLSGLALSRFARALLSAARHL